jgi:hypothetical protein
MDYANFYCHYSKFQSTWRKATWLNPLFYGALNSYKIPYLKTLLNGKTYFTCLLAPSLFSPLNKIEKRLKTKFANILKQIFKITDWESVWKYFKRHSNLREAQTLRNLSLICLWVKLRLKTNKPVYSDTSANL